MPSAQVLKGFVVIRFHPVQNLLGSSSGVFESASCLANGKGQCRIVMVSL